MSDRYTRRDAEALVDRLRTHLFDETDELDGIDGSRLFLNYESGVYRLRWRLDHGETDLSPGLATAREAWLYVKGMLDGRGIVSEIEFHAEYDRLDRPNPSAGWLPQ
jgi:hypothetical protein